MSEPQENSQSDLRDIVEPELHRFQTFIRDYALNYAVERRFNRAVARVEVLNPGQFRQARTQLRTLRGSKALTVDDLIAVAPAIYTVYLLSQKIRKRYIPDSARPDGVAVHYLLQLHAAAKAKTPAPA